MARKPLPFPEVLDITEVWRSVKESAKPGVASSELLKEFLALGFITVNGISYELSTLKASNGYRLAVLCPRCRKPSLRLFDKKCSRCRPERDWRNRNAIGKLEHALLKRNKQSYRKQVKNSIQMLNYIQRKLLKS